VWTGLAQFAGDPRCTVPPTWDQSPSGSEVAIRIGGEVRLTVDVDSSGLRYKPAGAYYRFAASRLTDTGAETQKHRGTINLSFHRSVGGTVRIPIGSWTREDILFRPARILDLGS